MRNLFCFGYYFHISYKQIRYNIRLLITFQTLFSGLLVVGISTLVITLNSGFGAAAAKSPEMGVSAMAVSMIIVPIVSAFTKNKDAEMVDEIFTCYDEKCIEKIYSKVYNIKKAVNFSTFDG